MSKLAYFKHLHIHYESNEEYQQCMIALLSLQPNVSEGTVEHLDTDMIHLFLEMIYHEIKTNAFLCELCTLAANTIFSNDIELGLVILFSYDYLQITHEVLVAYANFISETDIHQHQHLQKLFYEKATHLQTLLKNEQTSSLGNNT